MTRDFCPAWGIDATLVFVAGDAQPPAGAWLLTLLDDSPQADALGYHEFESTVPSGYAFVKSDIEAGANWTTTLGHELLEMLADPFVFSAVAQENDRGRDMLMSLEVCDACEADEFGYLIDGVLVSDFVYPAWFGAPGNQFDHCGHVTSAWQLLDGGYISAERCRLIGDWIDLEPPAEPAGIAPAAAGANQPAVPASTSQPASRRTGRHILMHDGSSMPLHRIPRGSRKWRRLGLGQR